MHVLRSLASLLGRVFARLGQILLAWSRRGAPIPEPAGMELEEDGPPEHWLRYLQERSPWLVRGNGPRQGTSHSSRRVVRDGTRDEGRRKRVEAVDAERPVPTATAARVATASVRASRPAPRAPVPELELGNDVTELTPRPTSRVPAEVVVPTTPAAVPAEVARVPRPASRVPVTLQQTPRAEIPHRGDVNQQVTGPLPGVPLPPEWTPTPEVPIDSDVKERVPRPAPRVGLTLESTPTAEIPEDSAVNERALRPASCVPISEMPDENNPGERVPRPAPRALSPVESRERWPDLPDVRWSEPTWEVPSSQTLVRLQQRLARLQAEQAGSSWSGRHS